MANVYLTVLLSAATLLISRSYSTIAPTVITTYGPVSGSITKLPTNKSVKAYSGIPFAKAERFEYPVPPDKWSSTLHANNTNKICPQLLNALSLHKRDLMNEDCLQLSVYIPENATSNSALAVMLWIHGGAYTLGDTIDFQGGFLASEGNVIVVAAAYRLGVLGFLSSDSDDLRGNYGMMDQIEAMKWVNKNIERFGGNPAKVTIFGVSAGGASVALLMLSPLASGLYQNVIMQSGTAIALFSHLERQEAALRARSFAEAVGCDMSSLKECAKKKSVKEILSAQLKVFLEPNFLPFAPVVDGYFLPDSPAKLLRAGNFNKSNIIVGVTRDDGSVFVNTIPGATEGLNVSDGMPREIFEQEIEKRIWIRNQNPEMPELLIYQYTDWSNASDPYVLRQRFLDINTDASFKAPAIESADAFVKKQATTYVFQLEIAPKFFFSFPVPAWSGIFHGADALYLFGFPLLMPKKYTTDREIKFSKDLMIIWSNFAKTGNPNSPTPLKTTWPQYTADRGEYLGLSPNLTVRSKMRPEKMALWNEFLPSQLRLESTMTTMAPTTADTTDSNKDKLVMVLAILTGVFGALAVILLVLLIVTCRKRRQHGKDFGKRETINM